MICFGISSHYDALGDRNQAAVNHLTRLVPVKKKLGCSFLFVGDTSRPTEF